jgi:hypothetical protein
MQHGLLQSQSQSHFATDGQSVSMSWCEAQILDILPEFPLPPQSYCFVFFGAPSLTRGRACYVSVFVIEVYHSVCVDRCLYSRCLPTLKDKTQTYRQQGDLISLFYC